MTKQDKPYLRCITNKGKTRYIPEHLALNKAYMAKAELTLEDIKAFGKDLKKEDLLPPVEITDENEITDSGEENEDMVTEEKPKRGRKSKETQDEELFKQD